MSRDTVQPNGWVALKLPNDNLKVLQIVPDTYELPANGPIQIRVYQRR